MLVKLAYAMQRLKKYQKKILSWSAKSVILPGTNCIKSSIRKLMLEMPSRSSFQYIGFYEPKGFRACESMQLKLVTNWRSLIKNQLIQSDSALNVADKKLSKNNDYLMRLYIQVIQTETSCTSCPIRLKQSTKFVGRSGCMNSCSPVFDKL